jgi:hypothetical protein
LEQYKEYLVTGNVSKLGISGLTETKKPIFFEGRAMIQGNVCINRIHGIGYPVLGFPGSPAQPVFLPVELDGGSFEGDNLNTLKSTTGDLAVGANPILAETVYARTKETPPSTPNSDTIITGGDRVVPPTDIVVVPSGTTVTTPVVS